MSLCLGPLLPASHGQFMTDEVIYEKQNELDLGAQALMLLSDA